MYDFTTLRPRRGIGASKWQPLERAGVADPDVIPFSIADMDLMTAPGDHLRPAGGRRVRRLRLHLHG